VGISEAGVMLLSVPRISPEWQLAAQLALVKPKPYTKDKIAHAAAGQKWPRNGRRTIVDFVAQHDIKVDFSRAGDNHVVMIFDDANPGRAKRLARQLSRQLPALWFILADQLLRNGEFYTRTGRYKLELVRASNVRLRRSVRYGFLGDVDYAIASAHHRANHHKKA
jgi:hypothetical protein